VIGTEGDGAYMYNVPVSAHYVSAEQQLPVLWVIFNNQRWQAVRNATRGLNPDGYAASTERAPLTYFTVEQHYDRLVEVSGGFGERVTEARQVLPALERAMKAEGLPLRRVWGTNVGHKYTPEGKQEVSKFVDDVLTRGRDTHPAKARFTTRTLRYNEGRGIRVDGLEKHWERADVELDATANDSWAIRTRNTSAFTINRPAAPRRMVVDGQTVTEKSNVKAELKGAGVSFRKGSDRNWQIGSRDPAIRAKTPSLQGPIDDAFMDSFLIVRPTGKAQNAKVAAWISARLAKATNEWRAQFRGDARVKDDSQVRDADIAAHNLILWGDPASNRLLARIARDLPIKWDGNRV